MVASKQNMHYRPPSAEVIQALPTSPLRVLVSGCLAGLPCGTDGTDYGEGGLLDDLLNHESVETCTFCPEEIAFGTPRATPDCVGGNGLAVLEDRARVLSDRGEDWTAGSIRAARAMRDFALDKNVDIAILQNISAACGTSVIYDGDRRNKRYQKGPGVAAAVLMESGVLVVGVLDKGSLELLRRHLRPEHEIDPEARNHHESDWYRAYFRASKT